MTVDQGRPNLAARAERWSAAHWKTAVFGWLAFAFAVMAIGGSVGTKELADSEAGSGESGTAQRYLEEGDFESAATEQVLIRSESTTVSDPAFKEAVRDVVRGVSAAPDVVNVVSPLGITAPGQLSADGRAALVQFDISGDADTADERIEPALRAVEDVRADHPDFFIGQFGGASAPHALEETSEADNRRAELLSIPITLTILIVAFGALVAAGLPVLLGLSAVIAATGLSAIVSHIVPASGATGAVIVLIGMAVGIDYALFYLRRERYERRQGLAPREALTKTAATSGQAVLISGATVFIAMAGMLLAGNKVFTSIGVGAMIVVAMAMIGSLTVLPALMARLGDGVDRGRIPFLRRKGGADDEGGVWGRILTPVLRRPGVSVIVAGGLLVALAIPAFGLHTKLPSFTDLPGDVPIVESYEAIQDAFPGAQTPAVVVVRADDVRARPVQRAIVDMQLRALRSGEMFQPIQVDRSPRGDVATISIPLAGTGDDDVSGAALRTLRDDVIPATVGQVDGVAVAVSGQTAGTADFNAAMKARLPLVFGFVLLMAFVLLLVTFRSVVVPLKAILLNVLSVGAAYGVLVLVFQNEWAEGLLGFDSNGGIASWLPLFLFVLLFGLSMDYHVFILSRVKELVDGGMKTEQAVAKGIRNTAGTVTSAAAVMIAIFAIFATNASLDTKQMGFGLAVAVLIDATIIRAVLLPATMKLLGEWNWYLPRWLEWLPTLSPEGGAPASPAPGGITFATEGRPHGVHLTVQGDLSLVTAERFAERIREVEAARPAEIVVDLRGVHFLDSAGLKELVAAQKRARREDRRVVLLKDAGPIERVLALSGVDQAIETRDADAGAPGHERVTAPKNGPT